MPLNLLVKYNKLLDLSGLNEYSRTKSLKGVFDRDFCIDKPIIFNNKPISPIAIDGEIKMLTLFRHLTTVVVDKATKKREYEHTRSLRLHWVKHHLIDLCSYDDPNILIFSIKEPDGFRTYIYNKLEKYVVVLEPLRNNSAYYLLSAYHVKGNEDKRNKFEKKYKRRLPSIL